MTALVVFTTALMLAGVWLVVDGFRNAPTSPPSGTRQRIQFPTDFRTRSLQALAGAVALGVTTRWPVAVIGGAMLGWWARDLFAGKGTRDAEVARTEAIASWTEMLRDTLSGAHGLEETLIASAGVAPEPIRKEVVTLATSLEREPIQVALSRFADDLAHPTGDLVVAALRLAARGSTGDLAELLGTLAETARDECAMRLRVEAARSRMRTAVRVITGCTLATAVGLALFNRQYLDVYDEALGQAVLAGIAGFWGLSLWWLTRMGRFVAPDRFLITEGRP